MPPKYGKEILQPPAATIAHDEWKHWIQTTDPATPWVPITFPNDPPRAQLVAADGFTYERVGYPGPDGIFAPRSGEDGQPLYQKRGAA